MSIYRNTVAAKFSELNAAEQQRLRDRFAFEDLAAVPAQMLPQILGDIQRAHGERRLMRDLGLTTDTLPILN